MSSSFLYIARHCQKVRIKPTLCCRRSFGGVSKIQVLKIAAKMQGEYPMGAFQIGTLREHMRMALNVPCNISRVRAEHHAGCV